MGLRRGTKLLKLVLRKGNWTLGPCGSALPGTSLAQGPFGPGTSLHKFGLGPGLAWGPVGPGDGPLGRGPGPFGMGTGHESMSGKYGT